MGGREDIKRETNAVRKTGRERKKAKGVGGDG